MKTVWLVIPCYNEKEVLPETSKQLKQIMQDLIKKEKISSESRVAFVNDGSKDTTWNIISQLHEEDPIFVGINLAHNKGHQNALFAGLMTAKEYADAAISLDADLQDDVGAIEEFIDKFNEGKDIVYGVPSGFCSDQPDFGKYRGYSFETVLRILPFSFMAISLTADVPRSMPIKIMKIPPCHLDYIKQKALFQHNVGFKFP